MSAINRSQNGGRIMKKSRFTGEQIAFALRRALGMDATMHEANAALQFRQLADAPNTPEKVSE